MASVDEKRRIIAENLKENQKIINAALEKRAAHTAEKARLVIGLDGDETRSAYEQTFKNEHNSEEYIPENEKYISAVGRAIDLYDKLNCVEGFCQGEPPKIFDTEGETFFEADTVVYLKNPLADIAYNVFSKHLSDPRSRYEETFAEVCEEIYYSRAPYCILPIDNSDEGRMAGFSNMIRKYELKIVLTCNVESSNGRITKFALLQRELRGIECKKGISDGKYLEIGFNFGERQRLAEVLQAAEFFGFSMNRVDSLPIYYSEKEYYYNVVFQGKGQLERFLSWLDLEVPRYEIIGIYTHIKATKVKRGG